MRTRRGIEKEVGTLGSPLYGQEYQKITIELLLDIRELLLKVKNEEKTRVAQIEPSLAHKTFPKIFNVFGYCTK